MSTRIQAIFENALTVVKNSEQTHLDSQRKLIRDYLSTQGVWRADEVAAFIAAGAFKVDDVMLNAQRAYALKTDAHSAIPDAMTQGLVLSQLIDRAEGEFMVAHPPHPIACDYVLSYMESGKGITIDAPIIGKTCVSHNKGGVFSLSEVVGDHNLSFCRDTIMMVREVNGSYALMGNEGGRYQCQSFEGTTGFTGNRRCSLAVGRAIGNRLFSSNSSSYVSVDYVDGKNTILKNRDSRFLIGTILMKEKDSFSDTMSDNDHTLIFAENADVQSVFRRNKWSLLVFRHLRNTLGRKLCQNSRGTLFVAYDAVLSPRTEFSEIEDTPAVNFTARIRRLTYEGNVRVNAARERIQRWQSDNLIVERLIANGAEHVLREMVNAQQNERLTRAERGVFMTHRSSYDAQFLMRELRELLAPMGGVEQKMKIFETISSSLELQLSGEAEGLAAESHE